MSAPPDGPHEPTPPARDRRADGPAGGGPREAASAVPGAPGLEPPEAEEPPRIAGWVPWVDELPWITRATPETEAALSGLRQRLAAELDGEAGDVFAPFGADLLPTVDCVCFLGDARELADAAVLGASGSATRLPSADVERALRTVLATVPAETPDAEGTADDDMPMSSFGLALTATLLAARRYGASRGRRPFASYAQLIPTANDLLIVVPIVWVQASASAFQFAVTPAPRPGHAAADGSDPPDVPFLMATAHVFAQTVAMRLQEWATPGPVLSTRTIDAPEVRRAAGSRVVHRLIRDVVGDPGESIHGALFEAVTRAASRAYEGRQPRGRVLLVAPDHPALTVALRFATPVPVADDRTVRKLFEATAAQLALVCDGERILGWGAVRAAPAAHAPAVGAVGGREPSTPAVTAPAVTASGGGVVEIHVLDRAVWEVHDWRGVPLMRVEHGQPVLPRLPFSRPDVERAFEDAVGPVTARARAHIFGLVRDAASRGTGALLVVTPDAEQEAVRLMSGGLATAPVLMTPALIERIAGMDGATLLDVGGRCHAVGVILDGVASRRGDPSRGARFHAALRYVDGVEHRACAFVASADGDITMVVRGGPPLVGV